MTGRWTGRVQAAGPGRGAVLATMLAVVMVGARCSSADDTTAADFEFFEKQVRPLLVEHCHACHSAARKVRGGLRLDGANGWRTGGDSGPAIIPGKPDESLLIQAVRYTDSGLSMPPKGKLSDSTIKVLEEWVRAGAIAPEDQPVVTGNAIDWQAARDFWSYRPPRDVPPPDVRDAAWSMHPIDRFILARLKESDLSPQPEATREVLIRRLSFDLLGLPPQPEEIDAFVNDPSPRAYENLVDRLLSSPHFGERWGRHWLDIVRFAESLTLRGFVFKEAWRYRDYVVQTFNDDVPFNQFLREQIAGDLLPAESMEARRRQLVATTFLTLGNTNLEEQDKRQLDMDVVDEQLDVISKAFLAQTITCARCHDHKFDPIPARDYYALAGILRNTQLLEHENVSKWKEVPYPLPPAEESRFAEHETAVAQLTQQITDMKQRIAGNSKSAVTAVRDLPGVVVDDRQAKKVGEWKDSQHTRPYIGDGYVHDLAQGQGEKTLTFEPELPASGRYEVRLAYTPGGNRATNVPATVFSAEGMTTKVVNMREAPPIDGHFVSLGEYRFETANQSYVIVASDGADGHVVADAVQFLPTTDAVATTSGATPPKAVDPSSQSATDEIKLLEKQLAKLKKDSPQRPKVMTVVERKEISDSPIHLRGSVHTLGDVAPRGFLTVTSTGNAIDFPAAESGRRELADWLASPENPLPARVFTNRAWHWLFGQGLVRTVDNFGTTGETPSHAELLDHLALHFVEHGWSIKDLVRYIVLSKTYRQSSGGQAKDDPDNRLLSGAPRKRLDAESLRDAMLSISGNLIPDVGGPTIPADTATDFGFVDRSARRSLYVPVFRNSLPELFEVFDFADPSVVVGQRNQSTVAPQALFLLNDPFVKAQALAAAQRLLADSAAGDDERITLAFRRTLGRPPDPHERQLVRNALSSAEDSPERRLQNWTTVFQTLFATLDFRYCD
jgi:hypothetical protein